MLIYKITNTINGKSYIGQTIKDGETRWKEHRQHAFGSHPSDQNKVLYQAIRKYGLENFTFEVIQDNISTFEELDKAEIYWINKYNSFVNGYNCTFGGQQYHEILPIPEIIEDYKKTRSARKTASKFGIDHNTVDDILNASGVERYTFRQAAGKKIKISKDGFEKIFDSVKDCAEWFVDNQICKTKSSESARTGLKNARSAKGNGYYYGYKIENWEEE